MITNSARACHLRRRDAPGLAIVTLNPVTSYPGTLYATTAYEYDTLDNLVRVTDNAGNVSEVQYNSLGQKTKLHDPDMCGSSNPNDASYWWSYGYDLAGNLASQTDAKGQQVELAYDALNRLVRKYYAVAWASDVVAGASRPNVYDLMELRAAVDTDRFAAALALPRPYNWTDPEVVAGRDVRVRVPHFNDLRSAIGELWSAASLGGIPQFTSGAITSTPQRVIKAGDPLDLRSWLGSSYEGSTWALARRARAAYRYDDYSDGVSRGYPLGRRTEMWDAAGRSRWTYDQRGRVTKEERWIDGHLYTTEWTYDAIDRVATMTYPDGEVLTYGYGANGLLSQVSSSLGPTYVSGVQYNALSLPKQYSLGSGTTALVSHTYYGPDASGRPYGALRTIQLQQGSNAALVNRTMTYDDVGNIAGIDDQVNGENISYGYDDLDRLTSAGSPLNESFAYNQIGNITAKNGLSYTYDTIHKHAVASYNGVSYVYDANGCMTSRGSQTIKYNAERVPVKVDASGTICRFAYDGDNARRKRLDGNGTIHYVGPYERNVGNGTDTTEVVTKYYVALGKTIAFRKGGTLYYVGTDHLGSTIRVTDASFNALDQMRYKPYGESRDSGSNLKTDRKFTSQIEDAIVGLYWYNSRAYDAYLNRWVQPDTIVPDAKNPQALNRYAYTYNNPLKYVDPSGYDPVDWINDDWRQEFYNNNGYNPGEADVADRISSMAVASGYQDVQAVLDYVGVAQSSHDSQAPTLEPLVDPDDLRKPHYRNTRALEWGPAPERTGTIGVGAQWSGAGLGWSGQVQLLLVSAPHEFGMTVTAGAGGGAALAGAASWTFGGQLTNARRLEQLANIGGAAGGGGGHGLFVSADTVTANGVIGQELFVGPGSGAEVHGIATRTWVWKWW